MGSSDSFLEKNIMPNRWAYGLLVLWVIVFQLFGDFVQPPLLGILTIGVGGGFLFWIGKMLDKKYPPKA